MTEKSERITSEDVLRVVGDIEAEKVAEIVAIEATIAQLEEAVAWAEGESDVMGDLERPASLEVGAIYVILLTELPEEPRREA